MGVLLWLLRLVIPLRHFALVLMLLGGLLATTVGGRPLPFGRPTDTGGAATGSLRVLSGRPVVVATVNGVTLTGRTLSGAHGE